MKLRKFVCAILSCLLIACNSTAFAASPLDNVTLGELQDELNMYFIENALNISIGSEEFLEYITSQLIEGTDEKLASLPNYPLLHAYMAEYKIAADRIAAKEVMSARYNLECDYTENEADFYMHPDFLNKTIQDCRNEATEQENKEYPDDQGIASHMQYASYNASAAIAYARKYATSPNRTDYPYFSSDCTNFVSQCVFAGGMRMYGAPKQIGHESTTDKWYCDLFSEWHGNYEYVDYGYSTSWSVAGDFYAYWRNQCASSGSAYSSSSVLARTTAGSVIHLVSLETGKIYHSIILTRKSGGTATYCAHSFDRLDKDFSTVDDSSNDFRYINF